MKKAVMMILCFSLGFNLLNAQTYETGIGLRGGPSVGITIKHFLTEKGALEGILTSRWRGVNITGLYEIHNQISELEGLRWYYGFGAHAGYWRANYSNNVFNNDYHLILGLDGIIGLEYNFAIVPFNLSLDWKPAFNLVGSTGFWADEFAISARYIF